MAADAGVGHGIVDGLAPLLSGLFLVAGHVDLAFFVVPGRDLVAPPELAADAPVLDVVHPLVVGVDPVFRDEADLSAVDSVDGLLRDALAGGVVLADGVHGDEPLVGEHGFDDLAGAGAARHHQLVLAGFDQGTDGFEVLDHGLACDKAVEATVGFGGVAVDGGVEFQHADHRQLVALAHGVVVLVVCRRDLDHAGAERAVHVVVGDDRDLAADQRQGDGLADQGLVALIFGVDHDGNVAKHGFGAGGGHGQAAATVRQRVGDVPQVAVFLGAFDFEVGDGGLEHRIPVDQTLAAVDQALLIEADKGFGDDVAELVVHGEVFAAPVDAGTHAAHLAGDGVAAVFLPLPDPGDEVLARFGRGGAHVVTADALFLQLALDDDLRGDAGVVGAGDPGGVVAHHAVVAREAVHDGLVEGVAHVQRAGDVGRRQLDGKVVAGRVGLGAGLAGAAEAGNAIAAALPFGAPAGLDGGGFKGLGQGGQGGLLQGVCHGVKARSGGPRQAAGRDHKAKGMRSLSGHAGKGLILRPATGLAAGTPIADCAGALFTAR